LQEKELEITQLKNYKETLDKEAASLRDQLEKAELTIKDKNLSLSNLDFEKKTIHFNYNVAQTKCKKLEDDAEKLNERLRELLNENKMLDKRNKEVSLLNTQITNEKDRLSREKMEAVEEKNLTKSGVSALTREIEYLRSQVDKEKQNIVSLKHDRDKMSVSIKWAETENVKA
jgi:chromosome segregation ATPase